MAIAAGKYGPENLRKRTPQTVTGVGIWSQKLVDRLTSVLHLKVN